MVKITACVIVKNEEKNITRWLENMRRITKDIVVVDTGSEDNTIQIARKYGAKVYPFQWKEDFSAAKNFAIEKARGEWILFLDADEYFSEQSIKNIRKYIEIYHYKPNVDALVCKLVNIDDNDHNRFISEFYNLRMFRNKPELRYSRPLHETLEKSTGTLQNHILPDGVEIYHTGYSTAIIQEKLKRNLKILLDEIEEIGEQSYHYRYLCECYNGLQNYELAEKYAKLFIEKGERSFGSDNSIHKQLLGCMINLQRDEESILAKIEKFIQEFPEDPEFLWYKGELFFVKEDYMQAEQILRQFIARCEAAQERVEYSENSLLKKWCRAYYPLGVIAEYKGQSEQAAAYYRASLHRYRYNSLILDALLKLLADYPEKEIIAVLGSIYDENKNDIEFIVQRLSGNIYFPAFAYYHGLLAKFSENSCGGCDRASLQKRHLLETERRLAELYEVLILAVLQRRTSRQESVFQELLPDSYRRIYQKLNGDDICLAEAERQVYSTLLRKADLLKTYGVSGKVSQEIQEEMEACLLNIALDKDSDTNCGRLMKIYTECHLGFADLLAFIAAKTERRTEVVLRFAMYMYQQGKTAETLRFLIAALKGNPGNEDLLYALAVFFQLSGDGRSALKLLDNYKGDRSDLIELKGQLRSKQFDK